MPRPIDNPPNPWDSTHVEWLEPPPPAKLELYEERARSILVANKSPDIPFTWSINPYRGCLHACGYCYARTSHQYLGFGAGTDFDRKIVVKVNAPELLREAFDKRSWTGERVMFSGNTDCYQPIETNYQLTRRCLEVCAEYRNPVAVITKSALIRRDVDVLAQLAKTAHAEVFVSLCFSDEDMAREVEPWAASPARRIEALRALVDAGVPCGVAVAPIIPGLNDDQMPRVLAMAREAGATRAFHQLLRLDPTVAEVFDARLQESFPQRAEKVRHSLAIVREGQQNPLGYGQRMHGQGPRWEVVTAMFHQQCQRLGMNLAEESEAPKTFRRPSAQGRLFE